MDYFLLFRWKKVLPIWKSLALITQTVRILMSKHYYLLNSGLVIQLCISKKCQSKWTFVQKSIINSNDSHKSRLNHIGTRWKLYVRVNGLNMFTTNISERTDVQNIYLLSVIYNWLIHISRMNNIFYWIFPWTYYKRFLCFRDSRLFFLLHLFIHVLFNCCLYAGI